MVSEIEVAMPKIIPGAQDPFQHKLSNKSTTTDKFCQNQLVKHGTVEINFGQYQQYIYNTDPTSNMLNVYSSLLILQNMQFENCVTSSLFTDKIGHYEFLLYM